MICSVFFCFFFFFPKFCCEEIFKSKGSSVKNSGFVCDFECDSTLENSFELNVGSKTFSFILFRRSSAEMDLILLEIDENGILGIAFQISSFLSRLFKSILQRDSLPDVADI